MKTIKQIRAEILCEIQMIQSIRSKLPKTEKRLLAEYAGVISGLKRADYYLRKEI